MFRIGEEVRASDIAGFLGYKSALGVQGGVFCNNGKIVLINRHGVDGRYGNYWDPLRPGILHFYATPKGVTAGKKVDMTKGTNAEFKKGSYPIHVFSEFAKGSYHYLGEFTRNHDQEEQFGVDKGRVLEILEVESVDYERIRPLVEKPSVRPEWTKSDIDTFNELYVPGADDGFFIDRLASIIDKSPQDVAKAIGDLNIDGVFIGEEDIEKELLCNDYNASPGSTVKRMVNTRLGQNIFRRNLDMAFNGTCCLTGITERNLLRASHIIPWSESEEWQKTHPSNGLLLNTFHDSLFDRHLMTVYKDGHVDYADSLESTLGSVYDSMCEPYDEIIWPDGYQPSDSSLRHHNKCFDSLQNA